MQNRKRKLEEETNPKMPAEQGKSTKKKEQEGKMQDKWPKCARENQEKSARRTHLDHTRGSQRIKH